MVQNRINYNLSYFSSNYAALFVMLSIYSLLTNLLLSFVLVLIIGGMYGIGKLEGRDLDVGFAKATVSQLYTALFVVAIVSATMHRDSHSTNPPHSLSSSGPHPSRASSGSSVHRASPS